MFTVELISQRDLWNDTLRTLPFAHILQSWEWGEFKHKTTGWLPLRLAFKHGSEVVALASVGVRSVGPVKMMYLSKGPALDYANAELVDYVFGYLQSLARKAVRRLAENRP
ncbi:MAG: peptidoglycan bridge formation glycyltransferase FemA/FemB family protein [Anaerolineae bacterium]